MQYDRAAEWAEGTTAYEAARQAATSWAEGVNPATWAEAGVDPDGE